MNYRRMLAPYPPIQPEVGWPRRLAQPDPAQILQAIIGCIAIPVTADELRWSRTNECLENELVNESSGFPAVAVEIDDEVPTRTKNGFERSPGVSHLPTTPMSPARLNFTLPVDPVALESRYISE